MAALCSEIDNYAYLVKKYCLEEAGLDPKGAYLLETVRALSPLSDAEVVTLLFKKLGPTFMSKIKGTFAFAIYDAHVGRVLAACDRLASFTLEQAHLQADNSLVVSCDFHVLADAAAPVAMTDRAVIGAGEYKFGWRSAPLAYMAAHETVMSRVEAARSAALDALMVCPVSSSPC